MSWQQSTIDEACLLVTDGTHYTPPDVGQGIPFLTVKDCSNDGHIDLVGCSHITEDEFAKTERGNSAPKRGDVLFSKDGTVGKVYVVDTRETFAVLSSLAILRPDASRLDASYFGWVLKTDSCLDQASQSKTGSAIRRIILKDLKRVRFPLPPLAEQKRLAGILDAADALRAKRREALAQLDTLLQSTFLDMFGDPVTNPMGWTKVRSGELFLLPPKIGTITPAAGRGYLVVRVGEVGESRIAFERCGRVEISEKDFAKFRLERGDTVIARAIGSKNHLGKASFFADFDEATVIDSHVMRLRPDPIKCDGLWFYSLISSDRGKALLQQTGGATAVQFNINTKQASSVQVALPPLDLQHHFAASVKSVEHQKASQRAHLAELDTLFASLQARAFRGEL